MRRPIALAAVLALAIPLASQGQVSGAAGGAWFPGDLHVHDDHSSDGSLPRQRSRDRAKGNNSIADQIGQATRMGLRWLPLTDHRTYDQQFDPLWESSALLLVPGEEANGSPHANVFGASDSIVQGAARTDRAAFTHVQQSVWNAHSQDAAWQVNHPDDGEMNEDGSLNANANVQGMDLVEIWNRASDWEKEIGYSEERWNAGFRFGVAGASDSHFKEYWERQGPGMPTSSVWAPALSERAVVGALRAGHVRVSIKPDGPAVTLTSDLGGRTWMAGDEAIVKAGTKGRLLIRAERAKGMQVLVYRQPGRSAGPMASFTPKTDDERFTVPITGRAQPDWYRVEVRGLGIPLPRGMAPLPDPPPAPVMELKALASPLFVSTAPVVAKPSIPLPADAGKPDGAVEAAGPRGAFAGFADVASDRGVIHVVAEMHGKAGRDILYRRRAANGAWSDAGRVISAGGQARFPKVAVRGADVWVVWQEDTVQIPHRPVIRLRHSSDGGTRWQPIQTVRSLAGRAEHPDIALAANGRPVVVWQEIRTGEPFDVMVQEIGTDTAMTNLSRAGKVFGPGQADDTRSASYPASVLPAIAAAPDGGIAVAWQDDRTDVDPLWTGSAATAGTNPDNWQIQVVTLQRDGWSAAMSLGADDMADRHPDLVFDGGGRLVVAWESKTLAPAGRNLVVLASVLERATARFSPPIALGGDPQAMSERPRLGVDADGRVRAVWYDNRSTDWRWRVMTSVYGRAGWAPGKLLDGPGINTWPATSGGAIVFASTRNAARLQRDPTQQIFLLPGR